MSSPKPKVVYCGIRRKKRVLRVIDGDSTALDPRLDLMSHSPTGMEWGYNGSGPAQLALALAAAATGDDELAVRVYQDLKFDLVSKLGDQWSLTRAEVLEAVKHAEAKFAARRQPRGAA